jgi:cell division protein ZapA
MNEIAASALTVDSLRLAILTAIHIADELHQMKDRRDKLDHEIGVRSAECAELLDNLLKTK